MTMVDTDNVLSNMNDRLDLKDTLNEYSVDVEHNLVDNILLDTLWESNYYDIDKLIAYLRPKCTGSKQSLSVMHLNVQSLPSKFEKLKSLLCQLEDHKIKLDVILLCETFLHNDNKDLYPLPGYNLISKNRAKMRGGGVAIYLKSDIAFTTRSDLELFHEGEFETIFIETVLLNKKTIIGEIYRTPGSNPKKSLEYFESIFAKLNKEKQVIIGTDQNFDLLKTENHHYTASLFNSILDNSFLPTISKPTRITEHSSTLIDNIYINTISNNKSIYSGILLEDISDHLPIFSIITSKEERVSTPTHKLIERRYLNEAVIEETKVYLDNIDWDYLHTMPINDAFENFNVCINDILDKTAPKKKISVPLTTKIRDPWMTKELMSMSKQVSKQYRKCVGKSKTTEIYQNYTACRNRFNNLKRTAKQTHYKDLFEKYKNDAKSAWRTINSILNRKSDKSQITQAFNVDGILIDNPKDISEGFCSFFQGIGKEYASKIPNSNKTADQYLKTKQTRNETSMYTIPTEPFEIESILGKLKPKHSSGLDGLTPFLFKQCQNQLAYPISLLINKSIATSTVPECLKTAKVVPIYKSKARDKFANYRPVSLLPTLSKVLEKVIYKRLLHFFDTNKILNSNQFGFRAGHSTIDAVTKLTTDINICLDNKESTLAVFCDLSRAFDTIDHGILLGKLNFYGVRGHSLQWFHSYLSNRQQYVEYNGSTSNTSEIELGVPQGSVLGPLLFIIYMNDLPDNLLKAKCLLFADDTTIYDNNPNINNLYGSLTKELNIVTDWFRANRLSLNVSKTHHMLFTNSRSNDRNNTAEIKIGDELVERVSYLKFLGIIIDDQLKWDKHIDTAAKRISSGLYAISKAKCVLNRKHLVTLYYALIYPHLLYGITLWGNTYNVHLNKLYIVQKKIIRIIMNADYYASSEPLFKSLNILKLSDVYNLQVAKYVFSFVRCSLPESLNNVFILMGNSEIHFTRQVKALKLRQPKARTATSSRSILTMGPKIWNIISPDLYLRNINGYSQFKSVKNFMGKLKCTFLGSYIT